MALDNFRTIELIWDKANKSIIKTIKTASSDTTGRYLSVKILDGGQEVTLNNAKLQLYWEHPNFNTSGTDDFNTVNNGGLFKMTFSDEMLTNIGELNAHLVLTLSDGKITSGGFPIKVFKGADDGVVVPTNGNGLVEQIDGKIDKGNVTLNDLTQEVKTAMTGGAVAVVGENAVGTENIKDSSVTPGKTTFINRSSNLLDKTKLVDGYTLSDATGEVVENSGFSISPFYKVKPSTNIYLKNVSKMIRYNSQQEKVESVFFPQVSGSVVSTSTAEYIRLVVSIQNKDTAQFNESSSAVPFEDYYVRLDNSIEVSLDGQAIDGNLVQDGTLTKSKVDFIKSSSNLFDKDSVQKGYTINTNNELVANELYAVGDYIPVNSLTEYSAKYIRKIVRYYADKNRINEVALNNSESTFNTSNAKYIRLVVDVASLDTAQFNEGATLMPYENFGYYLEDNIKVKQTSGGTGTETGEQEPLNLWQEDRYIVDGETSGNYTSDVIPDKILNQYPTNVDFIAKVDELVTKYPDYITKSKIGADGVGDIFSYHFKPEAVPTASITNTRLNVKTPKMVLVSGVHGMERIGIYNLFEALTQITENWKSDPLLETLRWNVEFVYVPIVCNYGYNNLERKNENGIDLARNFSVGFENNTATPSDSTYGGTSAFSEAGSIAIRDLLETHKEDTIYFGSFHNYATFSHFIWNASATKMQVHLGKTLVSKLSRKWKKEYEWMTQDETTYVGYADNNAPQGSESVYAASLGIHASTFETNHEMPFETTPQKYNSTALTLGAETIINWLILNLKENTNFYNNL